MRETLLEYLYLRNKCTYVVFLGLEGAGAGETFLITISTVYVSSLLLNLFSCNLLAVQRMRSSSSEKMTQSGITFSSGEEERLKKRNIKLTYPLI